MDRGEHDGADRAHGAGFRRRRKAHHHGAEHDEDQHGRGDDAHQALLPQRPAGQRARFLRHRRHVVRLDQAEQEGVAGEQHDLEHRGAPGAEIHVADRLAELVGEHDQHQRGRHQLRDGAGGREHAGDVAHVVAVADHHRHRDQRHGDDLRRHRAGDGAEDEADDDDGIAEAAADRAEQLAHRIQHVLGKSASFQYGAHEGEERDREQQLVGQHAAEHAAGDRLQEVEVEEAEMDGQEAEGEADRGQRERDGKADQHRQNQAAEHQRRHHFQRDHWVGLSYLASIVDIALESRDTLDDFGNTLQRQQHEAGGDHELDGPADQAAGIARHLADVIGLHEERPGQIGEQEAGGDQEEQRADHVEPELAALRQHQIEDLDADMLVALEGVGRAEHHQDGEHVPLQLQPAVRASS